MKKFLSMILTVVTVFSIGCFTGCDNKSTGNVSNKSTPTADNGSSPDATVEGTFNTTTSPTVTAKTSSATPTNNSNTPVPNIPNTPAIKQNTPVPTAKSTPAPKTPPPTAKITPAPVTPTPSHTVVPIKDAKAGDYVIFGAYEQDNNISNGKEDIEWLVLERKDNKIFVISKYGLNSKVQWGRIYDDVYNEEEAKPWPDCSPRKWLNSTFINEAFSANEQKKIQNTVVSPDDASISRHSENIAVWTPVIDKIFLLSVAEVEKYFPTDESRRCAATEYSFMRGNRSERLYTSEGKIADDWFLRTTYFSGKKADITANFHSDVVVVCENGAVRDNSGYFYPYRRLYLGDMYNYNTYWLTRPAMWISTN